MSRQPKNVTMSGGLSSSLFENLTSARIRGLEARSPRVRCVPYAATAMRVRWSSALCAGAREDAHGRSERGRSRILKPRPSHLRRSSYTRSSSMSMSGPTGRSSSTPTAASGSATRRATPSSVVSPSAPTSPALCGSARTACVTASPELTASGVPLQDVQDAMGHADPRTTRAYERSPLSAKLA